MKGCLQNFYMLFYSYFNWFEKSMTDIIFLKKFFFKIFIHILVYIWISLYNIFCVFFSSGQQYYLISDHPAWNVNPPSSFLYNNSIKINKSTLKLNRTILAATSSGKPLVWQYSANVRWQPIKSENYICLPWIIFISPSTWLF